MSKWGMVRLGELLISQPKSKVKAGDGHINGKYKFFTSSNIQSKYCDDYNYNKSALIFGTGGNASVHFCDEPFSTSTDCLVFYAKEKEMLKTIYLFLSGNMQLLENGFKGAGLKHISKDYILNIEIPLPPLKEQKRIANELDKISSLIAKRKQQLEKLNLLVKSKFVEMFGDPVTNEMGWEEYIISQCLLKIENGKSFICENENRKGNYPAVLKLSAVTYGIYKAEENKAVIDVKNFIKSLEVRDKDLLFTRKNTPELVGMSAYVFKTPPNLMMPDLIFRLNTTDRCNKIYLWQLINHDLFRASIQKLSSGSAKSMSNISKERLSDLKIPLPPLPLQNQFADYVSKVETIKEKINQSLEKLEILKKARMQFYFE